jgi:hypothetical protein
MEKLDIKQGKKCIIADIKRYDLLKYADSMTLTERNKIIVKDLVYQDMTFNAAGNKYGVTSERVRQIFNNSYRHLIVNYNKLCGNETGENDKYSLDNLPINVANSLRRAGYNDLHQLENVSQVELKDVRGLGKKRIEILHNYMSDNDIPYETRKYIARTKVIRICSMCGEQVKRGERYCHGCNVRLGVNLPTIKREVVYVLKEGE